MELMELHWCKKKEHFCQVKFYFANRFPKKCFNKLPPKSNVNYVPGCNHSGFFSSAQKVAIFVMESSKILTLVHTGRAVLQLKICR